uniref:Uncharacterized protein n=1 Tax=Siphoviridae sp. ct2vX3 TaxID=2825318 RepID=A0A8S5PXG6_9CAUD|nr:MAG TPA: hypothetical protein [Siphoviridae sp. ct2vX3]
MVLVIVIYYQSSRLGYLSVILLTLKSLKMMFLNWEKSLSRYLVLILRVATIPLVDQN